MSREYAVWIFFNRQKNKDNFEIATETLKIRPLLLNSKEWQIIEPQYAPEIIKADNQ